MSESRVLRFATLEDIPGLVALEYECFDVNRRETRATIRNWLTNSRHETWVEHLPSPPGISAAITLRILQPTMRIYSIATHPAHRGQGLGNHMLAFARERARARGCRQITLEADASLPQLIEWYERSGFQRVKLLKDYYDLDCHAWRMKQVLEPNEP